MPGISPQSPLRIRLRKYRHHRHRTMVTLPLPGRRQVLRSVHRPWAANTRRFRPKIVCVRRADVVFARKSPMFAAHEPFSNENRSCSPRTGRFRTKTPAVRRTGPRRDLRRLSGLFRRRRHPGDGPGGSRDTFFSKKRMKNPWRYRIERIRLFLFWKNRL